MPFFKIVVNGFDDDTGDMKNVFYCRSAEVLTPPTADDVIAKIYTPLADFISSKFHINNTTWSLWEGDADGLWYEVGEDGKKHPKKAPPWSVGLDLSPTIAFTGAEDGQRLPPQVSPYLFAKTAVKHVIAKKFFGDFTEVSNDDGNLSVDAGAALGTTGANWLAGFGGGAAPAYDAYVWGPIHGFNRLASVSLGRTMGTQRRRKFGVGS